MKFYKILTTLLICFFLSATQYAIAGKKAVPEVKKGDYPSITIMTSKFKLIAEKCNTEGKMKGITMTKFGKPEQYIEAKNAEWELDDEDNVNIILNDVVVIHFSKSPRNTFNSIIKYESQVVEMEKGVIQLVVQIKGKDKKVRLVKGKETLIHENKLWLLRGIIMEMDYNYLPEGHPRHYKRMPFSALVDSDSRQISDNSWTK